MQLVGLLEIGGLAPLCCLGVPGGGVSWVTLGFLERAADRGLPLGAWVACVKAKQSLSSDGLRNSRSMFGPRDKRSSMSVTAAASGFVFILLSLPVVQAYDDWRVTYTPSNICAVKGSSVTIRCSYTYPATMNGVTIVVNQKFWFTEQSDDLTTDSLYVGRVSSDSDWTSCSLTITDLRESDSAEYKFRFITNQPDGRWTGSPGVTLSVTALHVVPSGYNQETLSCQSSCELNKNPSYIWYKNGQRQNRQPYIDSHNPNPQDSYSCAVNRLDHSTSPSVCLRGDSCNRVNYSNRSICAFKGSSVDISCTYNSYNNPIQSKLWFNVRQSRYRSIDLSEDSRYAGRVQVLETEGGRSTLRISDLTDADSADYRFKFKTQSFEWGSDLPGTTLTVTDISVWSYGQKLHCITSCQPYVSSYVWYKNGQEVSRGSSYLEEISYDDINSYSCALKGYEDFHSALVCGYGQNCNKVTYTNRRICAIKGSSVDISCTYNHYSSSSNFQSNFWFRTDRRHHWQNTSQPDDLIQDSHYEHRVQVHETVSRSSTLTIRDLRESDSAEYRFKFKTPTFEWRSSLPGTTLTVTALWVQVTRRHVYQSSTKAELKCLSSCSPAGRPSIVWIKNEERTPGKASYEGVFNTGDNISCAFIGHEGYRSPSVYAPRAASAVMSPSGAIMEGSLVNLTCSSDANPAANYTWYKEQTQLSKEPQLVFRSIQSNQSGEYYCTAENELGKKTSENILLQVKYAPKRPSVTVSPSSEIVEGGLVV
ncbi:B-cell receptor CD22-like isoform X2 [Embiotoca jacksoni]|uniref:B-cell receptor CD22-like isoform X2 n=1 Tax=Embiotoca jacksoni TaxID=100190 RepID=UPI0037042BA0